LLLRPDNSFLITANQKGEVVIWGKKHLEKGKRKPSTATFNHPINIIS